MKFLRLSILIVSCMIFSTVVADEYTEEMERYIVTPCAHASAIYQDLDYMMDITKAVTLLKSMTGMSETIYEMVYEFIPKSDMAVTDLKTRKKIYGFALYNCIKGATGAYELE